MQFDLLKDFKAKQLLEKLLLREILQLTVRFASKPRRSIKTDTKNFST